MLDLNLYVLLPICVINYLLACFNLFHTESQTFQQNYISKNVQVDEFMLIPVNEELCKLNPSKSTRTGNIPARFVKGAASVLKRPVMHIVNLSIEQNVVPKDMKKCTGCTFV